MSSSPTNTRILIIGAGLGGLTLAAICRKANIPCIVLERTPTLQPAGAGISLAPNALRVLDQLGIYSQIQEHGQRLHRMLVHYEDNKWRDLNFTGVEPKFGYPVYSIERAQFHEFLYEAAGAEENVRLGKKVVDVVDEYGSEYVRVKTADGEEYTADVVVGADGIRSVTRRILAQNAGLDSINTIQFTGRVHMSGYTKPIANLGEESKGVGNWIFYSDAIFTTWPCKDNRQWYIGVKRVPLGEKDPDRSVWEGTTKDMVNEVYGKKFHPFGENSKASDIIDQSERVIASNVFEEQDFPSMTSGRVALLGDAAHSMTSFFGQGACQAIEDATELANALITHYSSPKPSSSSLQNAFKVYAETRGQRGKDIVSFSRIYAGIHVARLPYGLGGIARWLLYVWTPVFVWLWALEWLYGHQPTVKNLVPITFKPARALEEPALPTITENIETSWLTPETPDEIANRKSVNSAARDSVYFDSASVLDKPLPTPPTIHFQHASVSSSSSNSDHEHSTPSSHSSASSFTEDQKDQISISIKEFGTHPALQQEQLQFSNFAKMGVRQRLGHLKEESVRQQRPMSWAGF